MKVHELAASLNMTSKQLLALLKRLDEPYRKPAANMADHAVMRVRTVIAGRPDPGPPRSKKSAKKSMRAMADAPATKVGGRQSKPVRSAAASRAVDDESVRRLSEELDRCGLLNTVQVSRVLRMHLDEAKRFLARHPGSFQRDSQGWRNKKAAGPLGPSGVSPVPGEDAPSPLRGTRPANAGRVTRQDRDRDADTLVWMTRGGQVFHMSESCRLLRQGQRQAIESGLHLTKLLHVKKSKAVESGRRRCSGC